jgi:hypothetical protein
LDQAERLGHSFGDLTPAERLEPPAGSRAAPDGVVQRKPGEWQTDNTIATALGIKSGWFSTAWGPLKKKIKAYKKLPHIHFKRRHELLTEMVRLIAGWKADEKHVQPTTDTRVNSIWNILPSLEGKIQTERGELTTERQSETTARQTELAEGGHSVARHGPEVSDAALLERLLTGMAPDRRLSPTPGASSRFDDYTIWLAARQQAATDLGGFIHDAQQAVLQWSLANPLQRLQQEQQRTHQETLRVAPLVRQAGISYGQAKNTPGEAAAENLLEQRKQELKTARADEKAATEAFQKPGRDLARDLSAAGEMPLQVDDTAGQVNTDFEDTVELRGQYTVVVDHGERIGTGFEGLVELKIKDLLPDVADWTNVNNPVPHSERTIKRVLGGKGFSGDKSAFARYMRTPANLLTMKQKEEKKLFMRTQSAGDLQQSLTNLRVPNTQLFNANLPVTNINTANWDAIQHFPMKGGTAGIQDNW